MDKELASGRKYSITPEEVRKAFLCGKEVSASNSPTHTGNSPIFLQSIAVWTMKCISYDADFQHNLAEKFPTFKPKPNGKSKKLSGAKDSPATKQPKVKAGRKRKQPENDSSDNDNDMDEPASEDSDSDRDLDLDVEMPTHQVYGTRSRPLLV